MKYILHQNYALRGWKDLPLCLIHLKGRSGDIKTLDMAEFFLLSDCDGTEELEDSKLLQKFLDEGVVVPGTGPLLPEQKYICYPFVRRPEVRISITNRCNCRCRHCYAADSGGNLTGEISLETFESLVRQMVEMDMNTIEITGGEPLLHPQFEAFVRCLSDNGIVLSYLFSNGLCLTDDVLDMLERYQQKPIIQVSFDGFGTHDWMRGLSGAEQKTIDALDLLKSRGFPIQIGMNINGKTAAVIPDSFLALARKYHPSFWIYYTTPSPRWLALAAPEDFLSIPDYFEICQKLSVANVQENLNCRLHMFLYPNGGSYEEFAELKQQILHPETVNSRNRLMKCAALEQIHIANDGRVLPCSGFEGITSEEGFLMGDDINIHSRPLKDILSDSSYLFPFQAEFSDLLRNEKSCRDCRWLSLCRGGCRLLSLDRIRKNPAYDRKADFSCLFYRGGYAQRYLSAMDEAYQSVSE